VYLCDYCTVKLSTGEVVASELFDHEIDPMKTKNVVGDLSYNKEIKFLSKKLSERIQNTDHDHQFKKNRLKQLYIMDKNILKRKASFIFCIAFIGLLIPLNLQAQDLKDPVIVALKETEIARAKIYLSSIPETVTDAHCERSVGGLHDFYSEGDYWWPNPENPGGAYQQRDGQTNPDNFTTHRYAMIRLSEITATLTSAWLLTEDKMYADKALEHLNAWFVDTNTKMNPHLLYAQAIFGKVTGRGIGLIDAYHFVEVARSVKVLSDKGGISPEQSVKIKAWFSEFLEWMTTHEYGISEMNWKNNHGTCWAATAASMAVLTENEEIIILCKDRFKNTLLSNQMAFDGSFPLELKRTKPYGYSLFNIDAFCNLAQILSTPDDNLFEYETKDGKSLKKGLEFIYPYVEDKSKWPYEKDIYIWNEWPVCHPALLFGALAYNNSKYLDTYLELPAYPNHSEVIRNLPVRHPIIWIIN